MILNIQQQALWDHTITNDIIKLSFDNNRQIFLSISTQVLKLASRYTSQCSKDTVSCVLIGSYNNQISNRLDIIIDRLECNLAAYLSNTQLIGSNDICIPLKCFKSKDEFIYPEEDFDFSINEIIKNLENELHLLSLSKIISIRAYAGFNSKSTTSHNFNWIKLKLIFPEMQLTLSPINKLSIFRSALINSLQHHIMLSQGENMLSFGYLTMDHNHKLRFLLHSDDRISISSLVGLWIHGVSEISNIYIFAACMRYVALQKLTNRICKPPFPFLLAHITNTDEEIQYYDVKWPTGPTEEKDSLLKFMKINLYSGINNLDRYYQTAISTDTNYFNCKLSPAEKNDKALMLVSKIFQTYISSHCTNSEKSDVIPRYNKTSVNLMPSNDFNGLEVPDISLLMTSDSNETSIHSLHDVPYMNKSEFNKSQESSSHQPIRKVDFNTNNEINEAIPRSLVNKQHRISHKSFANNLNNPRFIHSFPQLQIIPSQIFPYQTLIPPGNPYPMYSPNILIANHDLIQPAITATTYKPPHPPKKSKLKSQSILKENQNTKAFVQNMHKTSLNKSNKQEAKEDHKTDMTSKSNKLSKQILQLDREEDLTTLEYLVQKIINQRHQTKAFMISTSTNTSGVFPENSSKKFLEVSTDLPSFINKETCIYCCQRLNTDVKDNLKELISNNNENSILNDNTNHELLFDDCSANVLPPLPKDDGQTELEIEESKHFNELLENLENFAEQIRHNSFDDTENKGAVDEVNLTHRSEITLLEEAISNLRQLDVNRDFEDQYWETVKCSKTQLQFGDGVHELNQKENERSSLDSTILLQRINYVSLFLNSTILSSNSVEDNFQRNSSLNEQSAFLEELALKYLNKATTKFERLRNSNPRDLKISIDSTNDENLSFDTKKYLCKYNLNVDSTDNGMQGVDYYSSIRLPDGNSLPRSKHLIYSTPTPHSQPFSDNYFKKNTSRNTYIKPLIETDWSYFRILDGLKQQPSILPVMNEDSTDSWSQKNFQDNTSNENKDYYSEDITNVLDIDKLKQLPKYL